MNKKSLRKAYIDYEKSISKKHFANSVIARKYLDMEEKNERL